MQKESKKAIQLSGLNETMLVPLYARAMESLRPDALFYDAVAVKIFQEIDYDFSKHKSKMNWWGCCARTIILDREAKNFIAENPDCTVINLGSGLDDRFTRLDNGKIRWYNIDLEKIIELRKKFITPNERVVDIAASILDFSWMNAIENWDKVLVIAEGVLMYFREDEVKNLFDELAKKMNSGMLLLELMAVWLVQHQKIHETVKNTNVEFKWGVNEANDFSLLCPDFQTKGEYNFTVEMKRYAPFFITLIKPFLFPRNNRIGKFVK